MKRIIQYTPLNARKTQSLHDFFAARGKNGAYRKAMRCAQQAFRLAPIDVRLRVFGVHSLRMLLGDRLMKTVLSDRAVVITGTYVPECEAGTEGEFLYHFTPSDCVKEIMLSGLLPKDRFVYLTDAPDMLAQTFLQWKTGQIRATTTYALLRMDARQLSKTQKIFRTDRVHEYVTGKIDAKYISVVSDDPVRQDGM